MGADRNSLMKRALVTGVLALHAAAVFAVTTGRITGLVVDPSGNPVVGVKVVVKAQEVEIEVADETDAKGRYSIALVDATRHFEIHLEKEGFDPIAEPVRPEVGGVLRKNFVMQPAAAAPTRAAPEMAKLEARNRAAKVYNEGAAAYEAGELDKAVEQFQQAVEMEPTLAPAWAALALVQLDRSEWAGALVAARKVRELEPTEPLGLRLEYDALWGLDQKDEAEALMEQMVATQPPQSVAVRLYNLGVESVKVQDWAGATAYFERALSLDPTLAIAHLTLSQIQVNQQKFAEAMQHVEKYLERQPDEPRGLQVLWNAHRGLGHAAEAAATLARLQEVAPEAVNDAFMREGDAHFNAGRISQAVEAFARVVAADPSDPRAHYMLGLSYASAGKLAEAKAELERFLELAPNDPNAELARQMIASL
jgi:tetratricopeptide (TPR) repeat protein